MSQQQSRNPNQQLTRRGQENRALARIDPKQISAIEKSIEQACEMASPAKLRGLSAISKLVTLSQAMTSIRQAMTLDFVEAVFMPMQGSPLGFTTDRDSAREGPRSYPPEVVRDVMIEGLLRGLQPINNEITIISGRCYSAKNGMTRLVRQFPGLSHLVVEIGVPVTANDGALVSARASWILNGEQMELRKEAEVVVDEHGNKKVFDNRIPIRINKGMGIDAIKGKAWRKVHAEIYERLSGMNLAVDDEDAIETVGTVVREDPQSEPRQFPKVTGFDEPEPQPQAEQPDAPKPKKAASGGSRKANLKRKSSPKTDPKPEPTKQAKPDPQPEPDEPPAHVTEDGELIESEYADEDDGQLSLA